jgi:16S rRNA (guanine527-N7)-methyltransferase
MISIIHKYFSDLNETQVRQFEQLGPLYKEWNQKINVVSRKDIDHIYTHHILHSLSIAAFVQFLPEANVLDLGTGGGFPGVPLAILYPETQFMLVDGTGKKIRVVQEICEEIGLKNVEAKQIRAEEIKNRKFDFVVTRAVAKTHQLWQWTERLYTAKQRHIVPNGLIALKGGDIEAEIKEMPRGTYHDSVPISDLFEEPYFETKSILYIQW